MSRIPLWIVLKRLPMELLTKEGLSMVASMVGMPLYIDKATEQSRRINRARLLLK